jgi:acetyl-CoA carboxylase biotin carboxyl carrier protein
MDLKDIKELIEQIDKSDIAYFEVKVGDGFVKMDKSLNRNYGDGISYQESKAVSLPVPMVVESNNEVKSAVNEDKKVVEDAKVSDDNIVEIKAPIVGSFYVSSSPDKPPYVEVGSKVKKGDVLCIIEAMKLMNEIESDVDGEVVEVIAKNQDFVEYGAPLFKIRRG